MNKQVIINQADLDKLEESRCALFDFLEEKGLTEDVMDLVKITNITQHIWNLANTKHDEYIPTKAYKCSVYRKGLKSGVITPAGELITLSPRLGGAFSRKDEARRQLALDIRDWIETGDELYPDLNTGKGSIDKAFETNLDNIARAIAFDAPFSVFAKKIVKGYQDREWIEDLLECT